MGDRREAHAQTLDLYSNKYYSYNYGIYGKATKSGRAAKVWRALSNRQDRLAKAAFRFPSIRRRSLGAFSKSAPRCLQKHSRAAILSSSSSRCCVSLRKCRVSSSGCLPKRLALIEKNAGLVIDRLERAGLIERRITGADWRACELFLTRKGHRKFVELLPKVRMAHARIMSPLAASDQTRFLRLFTKLVEGNGVYARPGAGRRSAVQPKALK